MTLYEVNGEAVQPPAGWVRKSGWQHSACVKACVVCGEALWRKTYEDAMVWKRKQMHAGECQSEAKRLATAERRAKERQLEAARKARHVRVMTAAQMDAAQEKVNLHVDRITRIRMDMPLTIFTAGKFAPQALWLMLEG